ncbi:MAG: hypothetical protein ABI634_16850 [Acidobacteriota bacterium]
MPRRSPQKRGRPQKYGQAARIVAITLPVKVVEMLHELDDDLGWAIVSLAEKTQGRTVRRPVLEAELVEIGGGKSLIVVDTSIFRSLPGVDIVPFSHTQAFLALEAGRGMADLELAVQDRVAHLKPGSRVRPPLQRLLTQLQAWRRSRALRFDTRSIILVSRARRRA